MTSKRINQALLSKATLSLYMPNQSRVLYCASIKWGDSIPDVVGGAAWTIDGALYQLENKLEIIAQRDKWDQL